MCIITDEEREYLLENIKELLDEYGYNYRTDALKKIIDTWAENKADLIKAFKKHPKYVEGKFMIAFDADYERKVSTKESKDFSEWLQKAAFEIFPENLNEEIDKDRYAEGRPLLPRKIWECIKSIDNYAERFVSGETAAAIGLVMPSIRAKEGEKTSRVINRLCTKIGFDKSNDYNRMYAKYADSLSPLTIKRFTVLSISPLDYLTMSFGNSWASCHTIDKSNKRGMPNSYEGQYSSGTISYMLDGSSMVLYTVAASAEGTELWNEPKITRQMFHYSGHILIQGRLYPQSNDCDPDEYIPYRSIVQKIMSEIFDFPNLWKLKKDSASNYTYSEGTHYRDYSNFKQCNASIVKEYDIEDESSHRVVSIGHDPICIECGYEHGEEDCISCCSPPMVICAGCGRAVGSDDVEYIDERPYCRDCYSYCEHCEEYIVGEATYVNEYGGRYVCDSCLEECYQQCDDCDEWVSRSNISWLSNLSRDVCDSCLEDNYYVCDRCGEYVESGDEVTIGYITYCSSCAEEIEEEDEEEDEWRE